jgi:serine carboxypeptidase-like clade 2
MEGAFMENGPFVFSETNNSMFANPNSWNRVANMLYIEAPAGVGFSVLGNIANNNTDDNITADDNLNALVYFFTVLFPEYQNNDFYISGESYAGVYIPYLATYILNYNANPTTTVPINLKGILVGNPVTDWNLDADNAWPEFLYWHQLIDDTIFFPWQNLNCSLYYLEGSDPACVPLANQMYDLFTQVNYYDIYRQCIPQQDFAHKRRWNTQALGGISNCVPNNALTLYLNTPRVRNALHINTTVGAWEECANINYYSGPQASYYLYSNLVKSGIRINIYSGDTDSCVPTLGTIKWINNLMSSLLLHDSVKWGEWMLNGQVGGFYTRYGSNFRFTTIRGAGHMCIQWKPEAGFQMFSAFLNGTDLR